MLSKLNPFVQFLIVSCLILSSQAKSTKILTLGDSITQARGDYYSYRYWLWQKLVDANVDFDFVGSADFHYALNGGAGPNDKTYPDYPSYKGKSFDRDHQGFGAWRCDDILNGASFFTEAGQLSDWLDTYTADIALVHLGTNDIITGQSTASTVTELEQIISALQADNPKITIFLAKIIYLKYTGGLGNAGVIDLNAEMDGIASRMTTANSKVVVVDQYTDFDPNTDMYDNYHPNEIGEKKIAQRWLDALADELNFSGLTSSTTNQAYNLANHGQIETVDLSSEGSTDWIHWTADAQDVSSANFVSKANASAISTWTSFGNPELSYYDPAQAGAGRTYSWSDGESILSGSSELNSSLINMPANSGIRFTVTTPASGTYKLKVYSGGWKTAGQVNVSFNGKTVTNEINSINNMQSAVSTIQFTSTEANEVLTFELKTVNGGAHLTLEAATLQKIAELSSHSVSATSQMYPLSAYGSIETLDLTTQGGLDWIHWTADEQDSSSNNHVRKTGANFISNFTQIGSFTNTYYGSGAGTGRTFTWSDGHSIENGSSVKNSSGINLTNGTGYKLSIKAPSAGQYRAKVYVGGWRTAAEIKATFNSKTKTASLPLIYNNMSSYIATIDFTAAKAEEVLDLEILVTDDTGGHITMEAVTLEAIDAPAALTSHFHEEDIFGTTTTFKWQNVNADSYTYLLKTDTYTLESGVTNDTNLVVNTLPADGSKIYFELTTNNNGLQKTVDYQLSSKALHNAVTPLADNVFMPQWWEDDRYMDIQNDSSSKNPKLLLMGDSITNVMFETYPSGDSVTKPLYDKYYGDDSGRSTVNIAVTGQRIGNALWQFDQGYYGKMAPKVIQILFGTNNLHAQFSTPEEIYEGLEHLVNRFRRWSPSSKILVIGLLPRNDSNVNWEDVAKVNQRLAQLNDDQNIFYYDLTSTFADNSGFVYSNLYDPDNIHLSNDGYIAWFNKIDATISTLLQDEKADAARLTSHVHGQEITGNSTTLTWTDENATNYTYTLGTTRGTDTNGLPETSTNSTSLFLNALPQNGNSVWIRLKTIKNGITTFNDYQLISK